MLLARAQYLLGLWNFDVLMLGIVRKYLKQLEAASVGPEGLLQSSVME